MENIKFLLPSNIKFIDIIQIIIIFFALYQIGKTLKNTRAWLLVKGLLAIALFYLFCSLTDMVVLQYLVQSMVGLLSIAIIIMFQPELQKIVEKIGTSSFSSLKTVFKKEKKAQYFSNQTIEEISIACEEMSKVKTGALIVLERSIPLDTDSGITVGAEVTNQLLINIFEKNTPLHDGAVIIQNNKVSAATCYLPLSKNNKIKKSLGTRHRAGIGISETTDAIVIVVSEETGHISVCLKGKIKENLSKSDLQNYLKEESKLPEIKEITAKKHETSFAFKSGMLLLSCIICFSIINIEDPIDTIEFNDIPVEIINSDALTSNNKSYEITQGKTISLRIKGHRSDLTGIDKNSIIATADFGEMSLVQAVPINVDVITDAEITIEILSDNVMKLELEDLIQAEIPVTIKTTGETNHYLANLESNPSIVIATGTRSSVNKIDRVEANFMLENISRTKNSKLKVYDKNGEIMDNISLNVDNVDITSTVYNIKEITLIVKSEDYEQSKRIFVSAEDSLLDKTEEIVIQMEEMGQNETLINLNRYLPEGFYIPSIQEEMISVGGVYE